MQISFETIVRSNEMYSKSTNRKCHLFWSLAFFLASGKNHRFIKLHVNSILLFLREYFNFTMPRSYSRSRSRSPISSSYRRSRSPGRHHHDQVDDGTNNCRLHVADLPNGCTKRQIEKAFEKWPLVEVWHAQASCFAFVVLRNREDVQPAIKELDGR